MLALTWIGVMGVPTVPTTAGMVAVTAGTVDGTIVNVSVNGLLAPTTLLAVRWVLSTPLAVGVPLMMPVPVFSTRPAGSALPLATA